MNTVTPRLEYRAPMDLQHTLAFLGTRAIPTVETDENGCYSRLLPTPGGPARITLAVADAAVSCRVQLPDKRDLDGVIARVRHMLDLDADPSAINALLSLDPVLAVLVAGRPGLR